MSVLLFYVGLAGLLTLEEAGVFLLPGDISLVAAGMHGAQGDSFILISWIASSLGMMAGASILFQAVQRTSASSRVLPQRAKDLIHRHGIWGVALARLVPGLRNAAVFAAAGSEISYRRFLYGLVPAALLWSGLLLTLGWFGGAAILAGFGAMHHSHGLKIISFVLLLAAVVYIWFRLRPEKSRKVSGSKKAARVTSTE
jgi:membrane protein DedA with SNARE-associated domain